jgi:hypothetical protein
VLLVTLPVARVSTLYARIGDALVYLGLVYPVVVAATLTRRPRVLGRKAVSPPGAAATPRP